MALDTTGAQRPIVTIPRVIVSADCHAGGRFEDYRPYLRPDLRKDFDAWVRERVTDGFGQQFRPQEPEVNWDSNVRLSRLEDDGITAEVIFPNTTPPFFPHTSLFPPATPTSRSEYERRWAGLQAHNRWLADFCAATPGRRAGIAQVMLYNIDDAVAEVEWTVKAGLTGGILLPGVIPGEAVEPLYDLRYEPLWNACEELGVPVNHHAGAGVPTQQNDDVGRAVFLTEARMFSHRGLWHLVLAGVFERHPGLRFVVTEQGIGWLPVAMGAYDSYWHRMTTPGTAEFAFCGGIAGRLSAEPSEYIRRNVYIGASFLHPNERATVEHVGPERVMWGSDFPHAEGTHPFSAEAFALAVSGFSREAVAQIAWATAAQVYGFDVAHLERVAPTESDRPVPADAVERARSRSACSVFDVTRAVNQL